MFSAISPALSVAKNFITDEKGQDFAEYAMILGVVGAVAVIVLYQYRTELAAAWESGLAALRMAR